MGKKNHIFIHVIFVNVNLQSHAAEIDVLHFAPVYKVQFFDLKSLIWEAFMKYDVKTAGVIWKWQYVLTFEESRYCLFGFARQCCTYISSARHRHTHLVVCDAPGGVIKDQKHVSRTALYSLDTRRCCDVESTLLTLIQRRNSIVCPVDNILMCLQLISSLAITLASR